MRLQCKPGLTGLAQVRGRNLMDWETKFSYDVEYVNSIGFWTDLKILFETPKMILTMRGVNNENGETPRPFSGSKDN